MQQPELTPNDRMNGLLGAQKTFLMTAQQQKTSKFKIGCDLRRISSVTRPHIRKDSYAGGPNAGRRQAVIATGKPIRITTNSKDLGINPCNSGKFFPAINETKLPPSKHAPQQAGLASSPVLGPVGVSVPIPIVGPPCRRSVWPEEFLNLLRTVAPHPFIERGLSIAG